jgi:Na+/melibiose symporter-like transporter
MSIETAARPASLWKNRDFLKLWTGQTISEIGSRITRDGLPLVAVITLSASEFQMGVMSAVASVPVILLSLFAGVWVDRLKRRPLMLASNFSLALLLLLIPMLYWCGRLSMGWLYGIAAAAGVLTLLFELAYHAYFPFLVERRAIVEGNSKMAFSGAVAELAGPSLAGVLIQALTAPVAILVDSLSYLASLIGIAAIRKPEPAPVAAEERASLRADLQEGLRFVFGNPVLRALALTAGTRSFFGNFFAALYSLFLYRELGLGPALIGLTISMGGIGDLFGSLLAQPAARRFGLGPTLIGTLALSFFAGILIPLAGGSQLTILGMLFAAQLFGDGLHAIFDIHSVSLRQAVTPDRLLGRAQSAMRLLAGGIGPLGALAGGALGVALGARATIWVAEFGLLVSILWLVFSPIPRLRAVPEGEAL